MATARLWPTGGRRRCGDAGMWARGGAMIVEMATTLPQALTRQTLRAQVNRAEMMLIESKARASGLSVGNYVRSLLGLPERSAGRPTRAQMEAEQDHAWQTLKTVGIDPASFFPADESWLDDYQ